MFNLLNVRNIFIINYAKIFLRHFLDNFSLSCQKISAEGVRLAGCVGLASARITSIFSVQRGAH